MANIQPNTVAKIPHKIPKDLHKLLRSNKGVLDKWEKLTPLAQNEWICWITIVNPARFLAPRLGNAKGYFRIALALRRQ